MSIAYLWALRVAMICNDLVKMACPCSGDRGTSVSFNGHRCSHLCVCKSNVKVRWGKETETKMVVCRKTVSCHSVSHSIPLDLGAEGSVLYKRKQSEINTDKKSLTSGYPQKHWRLPQRWTAKLGSTRETCYLTFRVHPICISCKYYLS